MRHGCLVFGLEGAMVLDRLVRARASHDVDASTAALCSWNMAHLDFNS